MQGTILSGRYYIIRHLGGGGFAQTYLAEDRQRPGNPQCVVKQLKPNVQSNDPNYLFTLQTARRLFDSEAEVLEKLGEHPQIPRLLAHFEENQEFYLIQEFIEGHDLSREVTPGKMLSESYVIALLEDILQTLEYVHQQNVIHRDLTPANLIRRQSDGKIFVIDFGAVKEIGTQVVNSQGQPQQSIVIGTPGYIPEEQRIGRPQLSSDIYAVGIIGIQALTGIIPQKAPGASSEIIWRNPTLQVSLGLANILEKMVRVDFRLRYQSATDALQAVRGLVNPTLPDPAGGSNVLTTLVLFIQQQNRKPIAILLTALIGSIGLGVAGFYGMKAVNSSNAYNSYSEGKKLYDLKRYEEAIAAYEKAIQAMPEYSEAWIDKGKALSDLQRFNDALNAYDKAIQINDKNADAWIGRGNVLQEFNRYSEALAAYEKGRLIQPDNGESWNGIGQMLDNLQRHEEALTAYEKAVNFFDEALKTKPDDHKALNIRGVALFGLEKFDEAFMSIDRALKIKPDSHEYLSNRGYLKMQQSPPQFDEAITDFDAAIKIKPDYVFALSSRGYALNGKEHFDDAIAFFEKAIKINPEAFYAWTGKGYSLFGNKKFDEALDAYSKALQINPDIIDALIGKGLALYSKGNYDEALTPFDKADKLKPDNPIILTHKGLALYNLNRHEEAVTTFERAIKKIKSDKDFLAWNERGYALNQLKRYDEALESFKKAIDINDKDVEAWNGRCLVLNSKETYQEAVNACIEAIKINDNHLSAWINTGFALDRLEKYPGALTAYNKALEIDPNSQNAKEGRDRVQSHLGTQR